jgi:hypothetical protein
MFTCPCFRFWDGETGSRANFGSSLALAAKPRSLTSFGKTNPGEGGLERTWVMLDE